MDRLALGLAAGLILWTYARLDQNPVLERPRLSQVLVLFFSALLALVASLVAKWLAGRPGRFDDDGRARKLEESRMAIPPQRPSRRSWWLLIACIVVRLTLLVWLQPRRQCTHLSVEPLLPSLFAIYDKFMSRRRPAVPKDEEEEEDDIENDMFQDIAAGFQRSLAVNVIGALVLFAGVWVISRPASNSTVICPATVSVYRIIAFQCLGLVLDATILILLWRRLQWARTTRDRFAELAVILGAATCCISFIALFEARQALGAELDGIGPLYYFHIFSQSLIFLFISATLFTLQSSPLASTAIVTFLCGAYAAWGRLYLVGTFEQLSKAQVVLGTCILGTGFMIIAIRNHIRHIFFSRSVLLLFLCSWMIGSLIYSMVVTGVLDRHPLDKIIYSTRTEGARWLVQEAKVSESLSVATREYKERHNGRDPPQNFDIWYDYATKRNSEIIDHFQQIDDDLRPFWSIKPSKIQEEISKLGSSRGMVIVSIRSGVVAPQPSTEPYDNVIMGDLVALIQHFAQHLPDMDLPVNLLEGPRVLAPWSSGPPSLQEELEDKSFLWSWEHQHQLGQACDGDSPSRVGFYSQNGEFCWSCAAPQSTEQFLFDTERGRDLCHQPDMLNLHGFYNSHHSLRPSSDLVPVFSRTKTAQHKDILIPLSRGSDDYTAAMDDPPFLEKHNQLFWRGEVRAEKIMPPTLISGGHQERLSHLINNASDKDAVTMLLAKSGDEAKFQYEKTKLLVANRLLKFDVGISDYSACTARECDDAKNEFGMQPQDQNDKAKLNSRYVMVMDSDEGPPTDFLMVLRSACVPFVASVFKEWYTERLRPWLHYVPIDFRFHGLHSTMAYFSGLSDKGLVNGRLVPMSPQVDDAKWISQEGRRWAARAIRREDAEIYMFRLLLEWGRVINEKRDEIGFVERIGKPA